LKHELTIKIYDEISLLDFELGSEVTC